MVVGDLCTLSNVHNTNTNSISLLAALAMRPHGTPTKYTCLSSTLHFTLGVGEEVPCNLIQVVSNTPRGTSAFGGSITTFYEFA